VALSLTVNALPRPSGASSVRNTPTTQSRGASSAGTTTTSTPAVEDSALIPTSPQTAPGTDVGPSRGCGFAIDDVAVKIPPSKKKVIPTLKVRPIGHCTVLMIGDSLGDDVGYGVGNELSTTTQIRYANRAKVSSGLVVESFYNWPVKLRSMLAEYHPNLVIVCLGGNDEEGIYTDGRAAPFGSKLWKTAYDARIRQVAAEARKAGALVLWVGMPIMQPHEYNLGILTLNRQFLLETQKIPGTTFLSIYDLLATAGGRYESAAEVNHQFVTLRASDGIHLAYPAEQVVGTYVVETMSAIYHVHIRPHGPEKIDQ
jgi:uncharacterized protein